MTVLTDLKTRGVEDILITTTDNLGGFTQTIRTVFPHSATQICVVHQIRNSCRYVAWKDKREFTRDMRDIYAAPIRQTAQAALQSFEGKWGDEAVLKSVYLALRQVTKKWTMPIGLSASKVSISVLSSKELGHCPEPVFNCF